MADEEVHILQLISFHTPMENKHIPCISHWLKEVNCWICDKWPDDDLSMLADVKVY